MTQESSATVHAGTPGPRSGGVLLVALRMIASLQLAAILLQAVTAGGMLGGSMEEALHGQTGGLVHAFGALQLIAAIVYWRPGRGKGWPTWASVALLLGGFVQAALGGSGAVSVHVPVGMALAIVATWVVVWAWSTRSTKTAVDG